MSRKSGAVTVWVAWGILAAVGGVLTLTPGEVKACGGLFCNSRPPDPFAPLPIAQNGENVVFSITPDPAGGAPTLVAHIQILYTGDAAKFSWVVPVDAAPVLSVGTDRLFTALANVTRPQFVTQSAVDGTCLPNSGSGGSTGTGSGGSAASTGGASGAGGASGGVTVNFQGAVGPFDAAVIMSDDATALKLWLTTNGYIVSDAAGALIDVYVREHKYFVALKLLNGVGVRSIQPIVLTFRGTEPCVPLRLTAIAANADMPVLLWVFANKRTVPKGFYEIKIDEARIDWLSAGQNYFGPKGLVSLAADEAGGNAFVTEYAGPSTIARASVYQNGQFNLATLQAAMTPPVYVQAVISMGLANDPLMLPLLAEYIPMPQAVKDMNISESMFYGNLSFYWGQFTFPTYNLAGLTDAIQKKIIQPRMDAQMMIDGRPYLTRLNTYLSPEEMNKDPLFFVNSDLQDVSNVHTATLRTMCGNQEYMACNAPVRIELADGRKAWVRSGSKVATCAFTGYDLTGLKSLPAAEVAWDRDVTGEGTRVIDNATAIRNGIITNNNRFPAEQARFPIEPVQTGGVSGTGGAVGSTGGVSGTGGGLPGTGGGLPGTGGKSGGGGVGSGGEPGSGGQLGGGGLSGTGGKNVPAGKYSGDGCACTTVGGDRGASLTALGVVIGLLVVGRRRRSAR